MKQKIYKTVKYSPLTKSKLNILIPYIDDNTSDLYKKYKIYNTGVYANSDSTKNVYSVASGVVLFIVKSYDNKLAITIQFDADVCFIYSRITKTELSENDVVNQGQLIGQYSDKFHFQYLKRNYISTNNQNINVGTSYIYNMSYFQLDPIDFVEGKKDLDKESIISESEINPLLETDFGEG